MAPGALAAEQRLAAAAFVERTLAEHPDRELPAAGLIAALRDVERIDGAVLDGAAVELGRRLARLHGLPAPKFPVEFHADFSKLGDRDLALLVLQLARRLQADAAPWPSREVGFLVLGAARLLAADLLILPPWRRGGRTDPRDGVAVGPSHPAGTQ